MTNARLLGLASSILLVCSACVIPAFSATTSEAAPPLTGEVSKQQALDSTVTTGVTAQSTTDGPIVIDNDVEQPSPNQTAEVPQAPISGDHEISLGTKFPLHMLTSHTSKTAQNGDSVEAMLDTDISINQKLVAPKGSKIVGHVVSCEHSQHFMKSLNTKRRGRMGASVGLQFDAFLTPDGIRVPIAARPSAQIHVIDNKAMGRCLDINKEGNIALPLSSQLKAQALSLAIRSGASAAGPFSFGAVPAAFAVMGAVKPSLFMLRPVGANEPHRRLKGMGLGLLNGLPGGFVLADCFVKGGEVSILPGDKLSAEFTQAMTAPSLEEEVAIQPKKEVHGTVVR